jgi:2-amino-4-hydroxy-6-hydroxymethyldihydropteridine diphosphokinase
MSSCGYDWQMEQGLEKPQSILEPNWLDQAVVVALGSNLPGRGICCELLLESAVVRLQEIGFRLRARSSWWRSQAWPDPTDPPFTNGVALFEADLPPHEVLADLLSVEREFGRSRGQTNAPRTLDLDLVAHGRTVTDEVGLILPHPRAHERRFVMGPLAEAAPGWRHPVLGQTAIALAKQAPLGADARPLRRAALHKTP